jgi:hypothetical protein
MDASSPVLVMAFGGLAMGNAGAPPFEFFRMLGEHGSIKKVFVRDHYQAWYHRGVRGLADEIEGIEAALRQTISEADVSKVVTLGTSAGGYAALLFGRLLGVTEVHAFGPQTFISPELRRLHGDDRFESAILSLLSSGSYRAEYADLNEAFNHTPPRDTRFFVHYCDGDSLDAIHASHMEGQSGLHLLSYEGDRHNVVDHLNRRNELQDLMRQIASANPSRSGA